MKFTDDVERLECSWVYLNGYGGEKWIQFFWKFDIIMHNNSDEKDNGNSESIGDES